MYYHLILTDECNLCCTYCRDKAFIVPDSDYDSFKMSDTPPEIEYSIETLCNFLSKDKNASILFYGGEPLLRINLIEEIMDRAENSSFLIYTNGIFLDRLKDEYLSKISYIFLSIDGDEETTDGYRGRGVYRKISENLKDIRERGFKGEIIARMTVAERTDICKSVLHLQNQDNFRFDSIHWQLDANFWYDYSLRPGFQDWMDNSYNPGISKLTAYWLRKLKEGEFMRWYPFAATTGEILKGNQVNPIRCGAGIYNYAILTDGNIAPCPCMAGLEDYYCGNIYDTDPADILKSEIKGDCTDCDIKDFCGGRCLYSNIIKPWPVEGREIVKSSVRHLKECIESKIPEIKELTEKGIISEGDFDYEKYNGCEIIP
ncbi:TIGR04084 family radical SAM/SPASM domain-containing protein [Methanoplanus endosymbiosus]|uniref:TIGR04084 family radical SAM/SPASM domain-containing protein n=1 Tax=Methanoplanus endosymbiosus TaxID=33865 RepID=A0A9E7TJH5_9EURY|nr:TIGR04084 family radical SAM/SPASM domain-containing protein [Methanoplanus endosymbiosus]UUX91844.1 TIGR04084 family radical SAM/SPASM domain-containing protein [Methanoplanus endosymbiosus]